MLDMLDRRIYIYIALVTSHQKVVDLDRRSYMVHGAEKE